MRISDLQYIEFTPKNIGITAGFIAVICMALGIGTVFFTKLIIICGCIGGICAAAYIGRDNYEMKKIQAARDMQTMNQARPKQKPVRPVVFNVIPDSGKIPDTEVLLKLAGIDKMTEPVINDFSRAGYTDQAENMPDLLQAVLPLDCLMIWGGRGAGKTNFIQHLAQAKVSRGEELWIIDPKPSKPGKWPKPVNVIGQGHNYQNIMSVGERYDFELECRKAQFQDVNGFPKVTLIVDELYLLNMKIDGFMDMILPLLLEGREYNIHMVLISQSKTAGSLGLKGRYDLLECFDAVVGLERNGPKHDPGSYLAVVDFGRGDIDHRPPGKYRPGRSVSRSQSHSWTQNNRFYTQKTKPDTQDSHDIPTLNFDPESGEYVYQQQRFYDSKMEKAVVEFFINNPGISYNAICNHIWGASNGRRIKQIKDILRKHNCLR